MSIVSVAWSREHVDVLAVDGASKPPGGEPQRYTRKVACAGSELDAIARLCTSRGPFTEWLVGEDFSRRRLIRKLAVRRRMSEITRVLLPHLPHLYKTAAEQETALPAKEARRATRSCPGASRLLRSADARSGRQGSIGAVVPIPGRAPEANPCRN